MEPLSSHVRACPDELQQCLSQVDFLGADGRALLRERLPGKAAAKEGAGEGGSASILPPAWRQRAAMVVAVAGDQAERRSGGGNDVFVRCF